MANIHHVAKKGSLAERERIQTWFPMFSYLESETEGIIPNEFEWPWASFVHSAKPKSRKNKKK
jgi:hypothetical protein